MNLQNVHEKISRAPPVAALNKYRGLGGQKTKEIFLLHNVSSSSNHKLGKSSHKSARLFVLDEHPSEGPPVPCSPLLLFS